MDRDEKGLFLKNNPGGPGRKRIDPEEKKLNQLTKTEFNNIVRKYLLFNMSQLREKYEDATTPALDLMVLSVMRKSILQGDERKMNWFLEQLFGRLKHRHEITATTESNIDIKNLNEEQLKSLLELVLKCESK